MSPEDSELIQLILRNNRKAFDQLYEKHYTRVYRFASYLCQSKADADCLFPIDLKT